jgi:hypothetical protein
MADDAAREREVLDLIDRAHSVVAATQHGLRSAVAS